MTSRLHHGSAVYSLITSLILSGSFSLVACRDDAEVGNGSAATPEPVPPGGPDVPRSENEQHGYVGVLTPRESVDVNAPFTSTIAELKVKLGDRVDHEQPLARLDDRPLREELALVTAALRSKQAEVSQANVELRSSRSLLEREQNAFKTNVGSKADLSAAEFNYSKAQAAMQRAIAAAEEQRARIEQIKARLVDTTLLAPHAGRVALIYAQEGARVEDGHPVIRVISSDELFVKFAIPSDKLGTLFPGDEVGIAIEQPKTELRGVIRHVAPELDAIAQMIIADADLIEPPAGLQSGIVCRIIPKPKAAKK
jgi:RND family efflux transporter MFP subunit